MIQSKIKQHEKINQFYPHSVNTIRLLTINNNGNVKALSAIMKFGINNRTTDNGGIMVKINMGRDTW